MQEKKGEVFVIKPMETLAKEEAVRKGYLAEEIQTVKEKWLGDEGKDRNYTLKEVLVKICPKSIDTIKCANKEYRCPEMERCRGYLRREINKLKEFGYKEKDEKVNVESKI